MRHGTYSITARDPGTGELGVAVHSHWFSVGPICAWARPGVGAVATQSVADPAHGLAGSADELLAAGSLEAAAELYERAAQMAPGADELVFWAGLAIAQRDVEAGVERVRQAAAVNPNWLILLDRLSPDFAPAGADVRRALGR